MFYYFSKGPNPGIGKSTWHADVEIIFSTLHAFLHQIRMHMDFPVPEFEHSGILEKITRNLKIVALLM